MTIEQAQSLQRASLREVKVVPNGVNTGMFSPSPVDRKARVREALGIPSAATIVGYSGGFPMQRGALQVRALVDQVPGLWGLIIGKIDEDDLAALEHPRICVVGEVPYVDVPELVGVFDVGVAFDDISRADVIGNSNQKIRQYLACGAYVITRRSDVDFRSFPYLGEDIVELSDANLLESFERAVPFLARSQERVNYAKLHLDVVNLFSARHAAIMQISGS